MEPSKALRKSPGPTAVPGRHTPSGTMAAREGLLGSTPKAKAVIRGLKAAPEAARRTIRTEPQTLPSDQGNMTFKDIPERLP